MNFIFRLPPTIAGALFMLASSICFSAMHGFIKLLGSQDMHPLELVFFRNFFGLVAFLPIFLRHGFTPLKTNRLPLHATRAVLNVTAMSLFFWSVTLIPLAKVQALGYTAPLFTAIGAIFLLQEKIRLHRGTALIIGFIGAIVILRPHDTTMDTGSIMVLVSAMGWGICMILIKMLSRTESAMTITFYMVALMTPLSLIPALFVWQWPVGEQWLYLLAIGLIGTVAQMAFTQSFRLADTTAVLPFDFGKLVFSAIIGTVFFGDPQDVFIWIGGAMIFAGGLYIAYRERHNETDTQKEPAKGPTG